jgi:hypothetical protein
MPTSGNVAGPRITDLNRRLSITDESTGGVDRGRYLPATSFTVRLSVGRSRTILHNR